MQVFCGLLAICFTLVFGVAALAIGLDLVPDVVGVWVMVVAVVGVWGSTQDMDQV
jgi:hypothetical protein